MADSGFLSNFCATSQVGTARSSVMTTDTTWELPVHTARAAPPPARSGRVRPSPTRWLVGGLTLWVVLSGLLAARHGMYSWHYFATAGRTVLGHGGFHVYAHHPELQFGPLTMAASAALVAVPAAAADALACLLMLALGLGCATLLTDLSRGQTGRRLPLAGALIYGFLLSPLWLVLAVHYGHLDDALALFLLTAAVATARRQHWTAAALLLAGATGAKPWILPMAMLLLAAPRPRRLKASALFCAAVAIPWIPFVLVDPRTLDLGNFTITVADNSVLRLLGSSALTTPAWDRPLQFVVGAALAAWLAHRGRWLSVPFAVLSVRLLLDPQTYLYYAAGLAVAAAIADLARRRRLPILTGLTCSWTALAAALSALGQPTGSASIRLIGLTVGLAAIVGADGWSDETPDYPASSSRRPRRHTPSATATAKQPINTIAPMVGREPPA